MYSNQKETNLFMSVLFSASCEAVAVCVDLGEEQPRREEKAVTASDMRR